MKKKLRPNVVPIDPAIGPKAVNLHHHDDAEAHPEEDQRRCVNRSEQTVDDALISRANGGKPR
ncbi:MAG: hypothetical protein ACR2RB_03470 [Gammaproteobacteria bacterium]